MATVNDLYINALLADASYVSDLSINLAGPERTKGVSVINVLN